MDRYLARRGIPPLVLSASQLTTATILLAIVLPFAGLWPWEARPARPRRPGRSDPMI